MRILPFSRFFLSQYIPCLLVCSGKEIMTQGFSFSERSNSQPFPTQHFPNSSERRIRWNQRPSDGITDLLRSFDGAFGFCYGEYFDPKVHVKIGDSNFTFF